jgi:hypothetical protein
MNNSNPNTKCLLCEKSNFDTSQGCLKSKLFTSACGDWVCQAGCSESVDKVSVIEKSTIRRSVPFLLKILAAGGEFLAVKTVIKGKVLFLAITFSKCRFVYRATDVYGASGFSLYRYDANDVKASEFVLHDCYDARQYFDTLENVTKKMLGEIK